MDRILLPRRRFLAGLGASTGGLLLAGCDALNANQGFRSVLSVGEKLHYASQRAITGDNELAREFRPDQMSRVFRANGSTDPQEAEYRAHVASGFANWRLRVGGMVERPLSLSLDQLMALPVREQITRHDCVEGWSAIGKWAGPQLKTLLDAARLQPSARYIVFHCADVYRGAPYYESIDLVDAFHPQTILAWRMNDVQLPVAHGAPIRLRVERQLGYKHAKYVMRIEARDRLEGLYGGNGGLWEDRAGYEWYAGI